MKLKLLIGAPLAALFVIAAASLLVWGGMLYLDEDYARSVYFELRARGWLS